MNVGSIVLGLLDGLTIGLLAVGLVLVYKSNRFLNLAHAQMGTISAILVAKWVSDWGWSWWTSAILALAVGIATGLAVERLFIGPLRRRGGSQLRLLLMSVAVSEVLLAVTFLPALQPGSQLQYPQPFHSSVRVGNVTLTGMSVLTALVVPLVVMALAAFLRYTSLGRAIRAAANNPDGARLCGISVSKVSAVTWAIAGCLAAMSAIFQAPTQPTFNAAALGPYLLMLTLGAAAFGAFVSLPAAFGGGLVLGLVGQLVRAQTADAAQAELAVFLVILLVVLVRGRAIAQVFGLSGGVAEARPVTKVPDALRSSPIVRFHMPALAAVSLVAAALLPVLPYFNTPGHQFLLVELLVYALVGVGLAMLIGWAGQLSLGHFALIGLGAYLTARWADTWSILAIIVVAGLIGAAVLAIIGLPALRVGGLALAVTTVGFAVISADWLLRQDWVGSSQPFASVPDLKLGYRIGSASSQESIYCLALVVLVLGVAGAVALRRSSPGRLVVAVRDNEPAASAFGVNPAAVKLAILALSGFYATAAGVLWAASWKVAATSQFTPDVSIAILAIPVIGGLGSIAGSVAAAVFVYGAAFFIGPSVASLFGDFGHNLGFQLFLAGASQVFVLLLYPKGIAGAAQSVWQGYLNRRASRMEGSVAHVEDTAYDAGDIEEVLAEAAAAEPAAPVATVPHHDPRAQDGSEALLVTEGIRVRFGGVVALDDAQVRVNAGEIVGLIGPNGAGKTTLMNVISGLLLPESGSVCIDGHEVAHLPADFRAAYGVGRTFQDARLFGGLTVVETIQVGLAYRERVGMLSALASAPWARAIEWRSRDEAEQIAARFGLEPWLESLTSELSTGTRRICDLAAQVAADPELLLLDEPTGGVAQREAEAFTPLLRRIRDELGCSVLIVEHDMPLLMGLCDRVYAMEAGRVIAEGTPEEVRANPRVIASYLGTNAAAVARSGRKSGARGSKRRAPATKRAETPGSNGAANGRARANGSTTATQKRAGTTTGRDA